MKRMSRKIMLPKGDEWIARVREKAREHMKRNHSCTQSILGAFMEELGIDDPLVIRAAGAMHAGMLNSLTCGVHTGGLMVLGLLMGRERLNSGVDGLIPIMSPGQELVARLVKRLGSSSCKELSGIDFTDMDQIMEYYASGDYEKCLTFVADGAEEIGLFLKELDEQGELFRPDM
jgi:C_GCAxxG_C_C family probable redox protein